MVDKEKIRKALEVIAGENKIDMKTPDRLYSTNKKPKEIETEDGLVNVRLYSNGQIEIKSPLGPKINIIPINTDEICQALCPKGAVYEITTNRLQEGIYFRQPKVCYVDSKGLVIRNESNIRINPEGNIENN